MIGVEDQYADRVVTTEDIVRTLDADELAELIRRCRVDFWTYLRAFNPPGGEIKLGKLQYYLASVMQGVCDGSLYARQAVSVPPQHTKSHTLTCEGASWIMGAYPNSAVAITGFSHSLVIKFSKWIRERTQHPLYRLVFPKGRILDNYDAQDEWMMANRSSLIAKSSGKKLTGRRVTHLFVDDPHPGRREAESKHNRDLIEQWYWGDCYTRLAPGAKVFFIATRWHPDDLIGRVTHPNKVRELISMGLPHENFQVTNIPATCRNPDTDPLCREVGEAAFPEVRTAEFLRAVKANIPGYDWESQFMGNPTTSGGNQADVDKIIVIERDEVPEHLEIVGGWDLAASEDTEGDFTARCKLAYDENTDRVYIVDVYRNQLSWVKNQTLVPKKILEDNDGDNVQRQGIEAVAGFNVVYQQVKHQLLGRVRIIKRNPIENKILRASQWLHKIEAGRFYVVEGEWNKDFIEELRVFGTGEDHDDQVDATSVAWETATRGKTRRGVSKSAQEALEAFQRQEDARRKEDAERERKREERRKRGEPVDEEEDEQDDSADDDDGEHEDGPLQTSAKPKKPTAKVPVPVIRRERGGRPKGPVRRPSGRRH